jgi:hypothetical protein
MEETQIFMGLQEYPVEKKPVVLVCCGSFSPVGSFLKYSRMIDPIRFIKGMLRFVMQEWDISKSPPLIKSSGYFYNPLRISRSVARENSICNFPKLKKKLGLHYIPFEDRSKLIFMMTEDKPWIMIDSQPAIHDYPAAVGKIKLEEVLKTKLGIS